MGQTCLHLASMWGRVEAVAFLLGWCVPADLNLCNRTKGHCASLMPWPWTKTSGVRRSRAMYLRGRSVEADRGAAAAGTRIFR